MSKVRMANEGFQNGVYDKELYQPVIYESLCTGVQAAGFRNVLTGEFTRIMSITGEQDLKEFLEMYQIPREEIAKEW